MARSAENFDADSEAEVAGETDMEVDIEKGERCNCIFRRKHGKASAFHFTCIHMRQGALSFDCDQAVSGAASCPPAAQRHSPRVPLPECHSQSAAPSDSDCDCDMCGFHHGLRADERSCVADPPGSRAQSDCCNTPQATACRLNFTS